MEVQFVVTLDELSPALFSLAQSGPDRAVHLGVIVDDLSVTDFTDTPMGMFLFAQITRDPEECQAIDTYLSLPEALRCRSFEFEYAVKPYDHDGYGISVCKFFEQLPMYIETVMDQGRAMIVDVCVTHDILTRFLGTPTGLFWLSQATTDSRVCTLIRQYLAALECPQDIVY